MQKNGHRLSPIADNKKAKHSKNNFCFPACFVSGSFLVLVTTVLTTLQCAIGSHLANLATCNSCHLPGKLAIPRGATCKKSGWKTYLFLPEEKYIPPYLCIFKGFMGLLAFLTTVLTTCHARKVNFLSFVWLILLSCRLNAHRC